MELVATTPPSKRKVYGLNLRLKKLESVQAWEEALLALRKFARSEVQTRVSPDVISFTTTLRICVKAKQWSWALHLLRAMSDCDVAPNLITYSTVIDPILHGRGWQGLLELLEEVMGRGLHPDIQFANTSITACGRNSAWPISLLLFNQVGRMREQAPLERPASPGQRLFFSHLEADSYTFNAVISSCAYGAAWEVAVECLRQAKRGSPDSPLVLTAASSACAAAKKWERALVLAQRARSTQSDRSDRQGALVSLGALLKACERGAQWALAFHTALAAQDAGLSDAAACCAAVSACEKSQQWQHAISLARSLTSHGLKPNVLLCGAVVSSCEYSQKWTLAMHVLNSSELGGGHQILQELEGRKAGAVMPVAAAMSCCSKARQWELVLHLLGWLQHGKMAAGPVATTAALEACSKGRQWQRAELLLALLRTRMLGSCTEAVAEAQVGRESALFSLDLCGQAARAAQWRAQRRAPVIVGLESTGPLNRERAPPLEPQTCAAESIEAKALRVARKLPRRRHSPLQLLVHARQMLARIARIRS